MARNKCYVGFILFMLAVVPVVLTGCASRAELDETQSSLEELRQENDQQAETIEGLRAKLQKRKQRIDELKARVESLKQTNESLESDNEQRVSEINELEEKLASLREKRDDLRASLEKKQSTLDTKNQRIKSLKEKRQQRVQSLKDQNQSLENQLEEVKEASTRREDNNLIITVDSRILFDLGEHTLRNDARRTLRQIADVLSDYENRPIAVEGHTDTVPVLSGSQFPTNWHLSAARAVSVVQYLTNDQDLQPDRLRAVGYGEHDPIKPNNSEENRRLNRRVEIVLYPPEVSKRSIKPDADSR